VFNHGVEQTFRSAAKANYISALAAEVFGQPVIKIAVVSANFFITRHRDFR